MASVSVPSDWDSRERFEALLFHLDYSSSPGYPYLKEAPTIGQWLGADGVGNFNAQRVEKLWFDVQRVLAGDYTHLFRVFIKDEPHKIAKAQTNRWRMIVASSLPVQMVWRMLFHEQNAALNEQSSRIPSKHGFVQCYGGWMSFLSDLKSKGIKYSRDISGWDVGAPGYIFKIIGKFRQRWPGVTESWIRVQEMMYKDAYENSYLIFSNGVVVRQTFAGFMKSGLFNTISDNSLSMVGIHVLACLRSGMAFGYIVATGDDVAQSDITEAYLSELTKLGCRVKEVLPRIEFMGNCYSTGKPEPIYTAKHLANLLMKTCDLDQLFDAYCRLYGESELFPAWAQLASGMGVQIRSRAYYQFWYSNPWAAVVSDWNL
nr:RNA-dependent RNA polymerase [Pine Lake virus]